MISAPKKLMQGDWESEAYIVKSCHRDRRLMQAHGEQMCEQLVDQTWGQNILPQEPAVPSPGGGYSRGQAYYFPF